MNKAIIGVVPLWDEEKDSIWMLPGYMQGLEEAGAMPVILPLTVSEIVLKQAVEFFDGFLFTGGQDVNPELYGAKKAGHCGEICEARDQMEAFLFREAVLKLNKPALGICRGIQFFNVMLGGSLYQDLAIEFSNAINHTKESVYDVPVHAVRLLPDSPLGALAGKEHIEVKSFHHQGINKIAERLKIMAFADDGLVEAVFMPDRNYAWAVQWHPELSLEDETTKRIFSSFTGSAERNR
ncbi:MAG: gamma-glutamyl-gamma-aminobutyrate hydrolase family protein [Treponema sp.]|nr:gamma-glutamyl-gamma-aminobutyrate hydrolase family protein [Treponema sp.]